MNLSSTSVSLSCRAIAAFVLLVAVTAGCSSDDGGDDRAESPAEVAGTAADDAASAEPDEGGTSPDGDAGAGSDEGSDASACSRLPLADVTALFEQEARIDESSSGECVWIADTSGLHQLHLQVHPGEQYYDPSVWTGGEEPEVLDGLGDEAFLARSSPLGSTAGYLDGDEAVFLTYSIMISGDDPSAKADALVELLRTVAG